MNSTPTSILTTKFPLVLLEKINMGTSVITLPSSDDNYMNSGTGFFKESSHNSRTQLNPIIQASYDGNDYFVCLRINAYDSGVAAPMPDDFEIESGIPIYQYPFDTDKVIDARNIHITRDENGDPLSYRIDEDDNKNSTDVLFIPIYSSLGFESTNSGDNNIIYGKLKAIKSKFLDSTQSMFRTTIDGQDGIFITSIVGYEDRKKMFDQSLARIGESKTLI